MKLFKSKVIHNCDGDVYLTRWYIFRTPWFALFLHKFHRSDEDRALHDHPWPFIVIPIWRGYIEHSQKVSKYITHENGEPVRFDRSRRVYLIIGTRFRRSSYRHRVELLKQTQPEPLHSEADHGTAAQVERPAWSLFIRFRKCRAWGFYPNGKFINWRQWWRDNCE